MRKGRNLRPPWDPQRHLGRPGMHSAAPSPAGLPPVQARFVLIATKNKTKQNQQQSKFKFLALGGILSLVPTPEGCPVVPRVRARVGVPGEQPGAAGSPRRAQRRPAAAATGHGSCFCFYFNVCRLVSPSLSAAAHRNGPRHKRAGVCPGSASGSLLTADTFSPPSRRARRPPVPGMQHRGAHAADQLFALLQVSSQYTGRK